MSARVRHIVLVRWVDGAGEDYKQAVRDAIAGFPEQVPGIVALRIGDDFGGTPNSFDLAAVIDFADRESWVAYKNHPAHRAYIEGPGRRAVGALAVVQHEW